MRSIEYSGQFKRDFKLAKKRDRNMGKIKLPMTMLINGSRLPKEYLDHPLKSNWKGCRDLHIEPDWLLIYRITKDALRI